MSRYTFTVPTLWGPSPEPGAPAVPVRWLAPDGGHTEEAGDALSLTFNAWPTMRERTEIERRLHLLLGGREAVREMRDRHATAISALRNASLAECYPEAVPGDRSADETRAMLQEVDLHAMRSPTLEGLRADLREAADEVALYDMVSCWPSLIVDPPAGWRDIADRRLPSPVLYAVLAAYQGARDAEEDASGKGPPSPR